jgi:hypothetical protein
LSHMYLNLISREKGDSHQSVVESLLKKRIEKK